MGDSLSCNEKSPKKDVNVTQNGQDVTPTIIEPSVKPSLKDSRSNDRGRKDSIRKALQQEFVEITRLNSPNLNTVKQRSAAGELWWSPLREIAELSEWNEFYAKSLISRTVQQMRRDRLTISSPKSILNVAKAIHAERRGEVYRKESA